MDTRRVPGRKALQFPVFTNGLAVLFSQVIANKYEPKIPAKLESAVVLVRKHEWASFHSTLDSIRWAFIVAYANDGSKTHLSNLAEKPFNGLDL